MNPTKDKILSVIVAHIKKGCNLESITLSMIASEADIGKSTLYEHFDNKEEMISETYKYLLADYESVLMKELTCNTFKDCLIEQMKKILEVMEDAITIMDAIMNHHRNFIDAPANMEVIITDIKKKMDDRFRLIFKKGYQENIFKNQSVYVGNIIQALISGLLFQYVNGDMKIKEEDLLLLIYDKIVLVLKDK